MKLKDKVAIVTGAGSGMGRAESLALAKEGCSVVIAEINEEKGKKVAQEAEAMGLKAMFIKVDVSKGEDTTKMAKETLDKFGRIDILVANAGILGPRHPTHEMPEEAWDWVVGVHLKGTFLCCKAVLNQMIKQRSGKIITVSSVGAALRGVAASGINAIHYITAKGGIEAFTRVLAAEGGHYNINVNCIAPGFIVTPIWDGLGGADGEFARSILPMIPLGRKEEPKVIADTVLFLVSEEASYITGQIISINGGLA